MKGMHLTQAVGLLGLVLIAGSVFAAPLSDAGPGNSLDQGFMTDRLLEEDIPRTMGPDRDEDPEAVKEQIRSDLPDLAGQDGR